MVPIAINQDEEALGSPSDLVPHLLMALLALKARTYATVNRSIRGHLQARLGEASVDRARFRRLQQRGRIVAKITELLLVTYLRSALPSPAPASKMPLNFSITGRFEWQLTTSAS